MSFSLGFRGRYFSLQDILERECPDEEHQNLTKAWSFLKDFAKGKKSFIIKTSGSTGIPKELYLHWDAMEKSAAATGAILGYQAGDSFLLCLNPSYIGGLMVLVRALHFGGSVEVLEATNIAEQLGGLSLPFPKHLSLAPLQLRAILADEGATEVLAELATVLVGGAAIAAELAIVAKNVRGPRLYQTFGMTETISHFALRALNGSNVASAYSLLPGVRIQINKKDCLQVKTPWTGPNWISTNDIVLLGNEGKSFEWQGRADFTINSGGVKIQPEQVESVANEVLAKLQITNQVVAVGIPDSALGQKLVLCSEGDSPLSMPARLGIEAATRLELGQYHVPKAYFQIAAFPRTFAGKLDRRALMASLTA